MVQRLSLLKAGQVEIARRLAETDLARKTVAMEYLAQHFRIQVLDLLHAKGTGHWGGAS